MSDYQELVSILKELLTNRFYPKPEYIHAILGDGLGNVIVPDKPDYNYVRFNRSASETFEVFNKEVSQPVDGMLILVGEYPWQPGLIQVVGIDWAAYAQTEWGERYASIQAHAPTHAWPDRTPGSDPLDVYLRAIVPLRGYALGSGSTSVYAAAYEYDYVGTGTYWGGIPPINLNPVDMTTGTMRFMGVYLDPAEGGLRAVTGATVAYDAVYNPPRPYWPLNVYPSSYVRVYGGQTAITDGDIVDARRLWNTTLMFTGTSSGGGGGGWPFDNVRTVSQTDANADHATIAAAITAASAGDVILLDAETFTVTAAVAVNKAVTIIGHPGGTIVQTSTNAISVFNITTAGAQLRNFSINHTGAGGSDDGVKVDATNVILKDLVITVSGASTLQSAGIFHNSGNGLRIESCFVTVSGSSGNNYGYTSQLNAATAEIYGGKLSGTTYDVQTGVAGSTLTLNNVVLVNGTFSYSGTLYGTYLRSTTGDLISVGNSVFTHAKGVLAYRSTAQTLSDSTPTAINLDSETRDDNGFHSTSTNTSRLTVPTGYAGWYTIAAGISYASNTTGVRDCQIRLNGNIIGLNRVLPATGGNDSFFSAPKLYYLAVGDYIEMYGYQTSGGNLNTVAGDQYTWLSMLRVG